MPSEKESLCCKEIPAAKEHLEGDVAKSCITQLEEFKVHLHPSILETFFKMNKKIGAETMFQKAQAESCQIGE